MSRAPAVAVVIGWSIFVVLSPGCGSGSLQGEVQVSVTPEQVSLALGETQVFAAAVTGADDPTVRWSVLEAGGGSIDADGRYTAPGQIGTYHVVATSVADPGASDQATVLVEDAVNPCQGVTCSGHGSCVATGGMAACQCESGYHAQGLACVADDEIILPDDPGPADVQVAVDSRQAHPISPDIYGHNDIGDSIFDGPGAPRMARQGGNRLSAYNWENNLSHAGTDWLNQNDYHMVMDLPGDRQGIPGEAVRVATARAFAAGADMIVTVQMLGVVATDASDGDVNGTPDYLNVLFDPIQFKKGSAFTLAPALDDGVVYMDELVNFVETTFPGAHQPGQPNVIYELDNEPGLWSSTHVRIHPDPVTYAEMETKSVELAAAIKDVTPQARVFGPVCYGWAEFADLQGAPDAGGRDYLEFYLDSLAAASAQQGRRLLDALDLHWYPEAQGGGVRITEEDNSAAVVTARVQAPRSLWDPAYTEDSWIAEWGTQGPIRLIPRLQEQIAGSYPGTGLAFTEYIYGGSGHISGAVAEADVLGVFGREGVAAASLWPMASDLGFIHAGMAMFLNYDGAGSGFGDTSLSTVVTDPQWSQAIERATAYASQDAGQPGRMVIVAVNKTGGALTAGFRVTHNRRFNTAQIYRVTSASATPARAADLPLTLTNAFVDTLPAMSVTTLVLIP